MTFSYTASPLETGWLQQVFPLHSPPTSWRGATAVGGGRQSFHQGRQKQTQQTLRGTHRVPDRVREWRRYWVGSSFMKCQYLAILQANVSNVVYSALPWSASKYVVIPCTRSRIRCPTKLQWIQCLHTYMRAHNKNASDIAITPSWHAEWFIQSLGCHTCHTKNCPQLLFSICYNNVRCRGRLELACVKSVMLVPPTATH